MKTKSVIHQIAAGFLVVMNECMSSIKSMKSLKTVVALLIIAGCASAWSVRAQITFGTATTISGDSDVYTVGTLVYAYNLSGLTVTVNGVTFAGVTSTGSLGSGDITLSGLAYNGGGFAAYGVGALSSAYQTVLSGSDWASANNTAATVTLNGLTSGHTYAVQFWVNDSRCCCGSRTETITSSAGNTITVAYNDSSGCGLGQYTIGTFTASSASQAFTITANSSGYPHSDQCHPGPRLVGR